MLLIGNVYKICIKMMYIKLYNCNICTIFLLGILYFFERNFHKLSYSIHLAN